MLISHQHKFIFWRPVKVAGTSIELMLSSCCDPKQSVQAKIRNYSPKQDSTEYTPPKRINRNFQPHMRPQTLRKRFSNVWGKYLKITAVRNPWEIYASLYRQHERSASFSHVIRTRNAQRHVHPNYWFEGDKPIADVYIRYEHLEDDLIALFDRLGLEMPEMIRTKDAGHTIRPYQDYYEDPADIAYVADRLPTVIQRFQYTFEGT
jgi:hypothetical protein